MIAIQIYRLLYMVTILWVLFLAFQKCVVQGSSISTISNSTSSDILSTLLLRSSPLTTAPASLNGTVSSVTNATTATTVNSTITTTEEDFNKPKSYYISNLRTGKSVQVGKFNGKFSIYRANQPKLGTLKDIKIGSYVNGSTIDVKSLEFTDISLSIGYDGFLSKVVFKYYNDSTTTASTSIKLTPQVTHTDIDLPFALGPHSKAAFEAVPYLRSPGLKRIQMIGYVGPNIVTKQELVFTIHDPLVNQSWDLTTLKAYQLKSRHEACFVMVGRVAVLLGGRGERLPNIYDPMTQQWTTGSMPPGNIQLHHMQCVALDNKVWIVAAWTGSYPKETNAPFVYVYDPYKDKWTTKMALPLERRRGATAVAVLGYRIFVAFGNQGGHETKDHAISLPYLDMYDTMTNTWKALPNATYPRDHTGGGIVNGNRFCVSGGRDGGTIGWPVVTPTECYNIGTGTWSIEESIPIPRAGISYGTSCDGRLLLAGGEDYSTGLALNDFSVFDGKTWTTLSSLNIPRHSTGLAVDCTCNAIYIASGCGAAGGKPELMSVETLYFGEYGANCTKK